MHIEFFGNVPFLHKPWRVCIGTGEDISGEEIFSPDRSPQALRRRATAYAEKDY